MHFACTKCIKIFLNGKHCEADQTLHTIKIPHYIFTYVILTDLNFTHSCMIEQRLKILELDGVGPICKIILLFANMLFPYSTIKTTFSSFLLLIYVTIIYFDKIICTSYLYTFAVPFSTLITMLNPYNTTENSYKSYVC